MKTIDHKLSREYKTNHPNLSLKSAQSFGRNITQGSEKKDGTAKNQSF